MELAIVLKANVDNTLIFSKIIQFKDESESVKFPNVNTNGSKQSFQTTPFIPIGMPRFLAF